MSTIPDPPKPIPTEPPGSGPVEPSKESPSEPRNDSPAEPPKADTDVDLAVTAVPAREATPGVFHAPQAPLGGAQLAQAAAGAASPNALSPFAAPQAPGPAHTLDAP